MKNLRTYLMTAAERENFDPLTFTVNLKAAGFTFDRDSCPVRITKPWDSVATPDGAVVWRQWDDISDKGEEP